MMTKFKPDSSKLLEIKKVKIVRYLHIFSLMKVAVLDVLSEQFQFSYLWHVLE